MTKRAHDKVNNWERAHIKYIGIGQDQGGQRKARQTTKIQISTIKNSDIHKTYLFLLLVKLPDAGVELLLAFFELFDPGFSLVHIESCLVFFQSFLGLLKVLIQADQPVRVNQLLNLNETIGQSVFRFSVSKVINQADQPTRANQSTIEKNE